MIETGRASCQLIRSPGCFLEMLHSAFTESLNGLAQAFNLANSQAGLQGSDLATALVPMYSRGVARAVAKGG
ncbi:hypothetical protein F4782DRAFT_486564 [Xylaria castorea]|nr:hypothetical protein F4782DRAFT_486564 [Xylaria castorea]